MVAMVATSQKSARSRSSAAIVANPSPQRPPARRPRALAAVWVGSQVMATMATMATPKLNLEKNKEGCEGVITTKPNLRGGYFLRGRPRGWPWWPWWPRAKSHTRCVLRGRGLSIVLLFILQKCSLWVQTPPHTTHHHDPAARWMDTPPVCGDLRIICRQTR